MKKNDVARFMQTHKQHIEDNGFSEKLAGQLHYYSQARKINAKRTGVGLIVPCCSLLAVWLTSWLGGWREFFNTLMESMTSSNPLTFAVCILMALTLMLLLALPVRLKDNI
jgi:hypothetical protein